MTEVNIRRPFNQFREDQRDQCHFHPTATFVNHPHRRKPSNHSHDYLLFSLNKRDAIAPTSCPFSPHFYGHSSHLSSLTSFSLTSPLLYRRSSHLHRKDHQPTPVTTDSFSPSSSWDTWDTL